MAEELQGLLDRINEEGLRKAEEEGRNILNAAKTEAEDIIAKAKTEAETLRKGAEEEASRSEERAKAAIQQAARDIILSLRADLEKRLKTIARECAGEAMTPEKMAEFIAVMVDAQAKEGGAKTSIELILNQKDIDGMEGALKGSLLDNLEKEPGISVGHDFTGGFKIGFKDGDVFLDFSDDAIAEMICEFIGPKLAAMLKKED